ncbi:(d)CMP kinase [bacterium]|nr:(d)CMP kinase [bacterium]
MESPDKNIVITLDGPAASGKSTTARLVAGKLGWLYLDTGAMYRAMAVKVLRRGISLDDTESIGRMAATTQIRLRQSQTGMHVFVDGVDVTDQIRTPEVDRAVGPVCEVPAVRDAMVRLQREIAREGHLVTDGRDMGTVVFPEAELKFYVTASIKNRADRRFQDMKKQGLGVSLEAVQADIEERDARDSQRDHSPLRKAEDAIELDTSGMTVDEQVGLVLRHIDRLIRAEQAK